MHEREIERELERLAARLRRVEHLLQIHEHAPAPRSDAPTEPAPPLVGLSTARAPAETVDIQRDVRQFEQAGKLTQPTADVAPPTSRVPLTPLIVPAKAVPAAPPIVRPMPLGTAGGKSGAFQNLKQGWTQMPVPPAQTAPPPVQTIPSPVAPHSLAGPVMRALAPRSAPGLEMLIGGKAMAWVGAIAVVLAAGFAIMVGVQRGWWGQLPPELRCLGIAGFGLLLLAGGEIALRRIGKAASVGLFGAGLGTLYLDSFATFRGFTPPLLSMEWAFALMALVAIGGFAITWRTKFLTIGVLSMVGGYLTPILLQGNRTHDLELLSYLTMLLGISLGLSAVLPKHFRSLRYVALGGQMLLGLAWIMANQSQWRMAVAFMAVWWVMVLGEAVYAALRRQSALGNVVMVGLSTMAFVTATCWVLGSSPTPAPQWLGAFTAMIGVVCAVVAVQFGPGLDGLRSPPRQPMDKLAVALWVQTGVLAAVAVALQFKGYGQSIGWMLLALAAVEIGRRLPSRAVSIFGLVVGALALIRVVLTDWWIEPALRKGLWSIGDVTITGWSILGLTAVAVTHAAAQRWHALRPRSRTPIVLAVLGSGLWMLVWSVQADGLAVTAGWLTGAALLLAIERLGTRQRYFEIAMIMLVATAGRWLLIDAMLARSVHTWNPRAALPVLNWQMGLAVAIAATGWWMYRVMRRRQQRVAEPPVIVSRPTGGVSWQHVLIAGAMVVLVALSFEVDRTVELMAVSSSVNWSVGQVRQILLTVLWTIGSSGIGLLCLALRSGVGAERAEAPRILARFAWIILALCAAKWLVGDTLFWLFAAKRAEIIAIAPVVNIQLLAGLALGVSALVLVKTVGAPAGLSAPFGLKPGDALQGVIVAGCALVLWGLSFEVDRAIARVAGAPNWLAAWPALQLRAMLWAALWALGGRLMIWFGRRREMTVVTLAGWALIVLAAVGWLTFGTITWRMFNDPVRVAAIWNVQFLSGALLAGLLAFSAWRLRLAIDSDGPVDPRLAQGIQVNMALVAALGLWLGSLEIDRSFAAADSAQTGLSIYWGLYGLLLVLVGFSRRIALARYAGLGLLSITLGKVFVFDMREVDMVWRAVSFAAIGLLLIGTSVAYARLAPRLLAARGNGDGDGSVE